MNAAPANATLMDPRWAAVLDRDPRADGTFVYSVSTTGVYCRPSCPSRHARPEHVNFHAGVVDARQAGFRPCRRCRPDEPSVAEQHAALVTRACRRIETAERPPRLGTLASEAGLSPYHFHRVFKAVTGVTPKAYADAHRARRLRDALQEGARVTDAIYDAGYGTSARFYEQAEQILGMKARTYRGGGIQTRIRFALGQCSLGAILVAASDKGLCHIALGDDPEYLLKELQDRFPTAELVGGDAQFEAWMATVVGFVESPRSGLALPLDVQGTAFQQRVWQALREVPVGETVSYAEIARRIGAPQAVRAVAGACAANTLAVAIPCHRVVRNDGALSGYRWGLARKRTLLAREAQA